MFYNFGGWLYEINLLEILDQYNKFYI